LQCLKHLMQLSGACVSFLSDVFTTVAKNVREKPRNLLPLKFISDSKRSNFENRTESVRSIAEKRAFRRIISRLYRSGVQSSNEKSLLLLGSIAN
jgi:hypothetical protein